MEERFFPDRPDKPDLLEEFDDQGGPTLDEMVDDRSTDEPDTQGKFPEREDVRPNVHQDGPPPTVRETNAGPPPGIPPKAPVSSSYSDISPARSSPLIGKSTLHGRGESKRRDLPFTGKPRLMPADPMGGVLGSSIPLVGERDDAIPQKVLDILEENKLAGKMFTCILRSIHEESERPAYVKTFHRKVPTLEWIGKNYGPGDYELAFKWEHTDAFGNTKWQGEDVPITISDKMEAEYKKHQMDIKLREMGERRKKVNEAMLEQKLESQIYNDNPGNENASPLEVGKLYLKQVIETNRELGLGGNQLVPQKGVEWDKILTVAAPLVVSLLSNMQEQARRQEEKSEKFMLMMLQMSNDSNSKIMELMKSQQTGKGAGEAYIKEFTDMVKGVVDLKELVNGGTPQKETVVDRIFGIVERVAPEILKVASMRQAERMADPRYYAAKGLVAANPDFQAVMHDPKLLAEFIGRLDETLGWEQTDQILEVGGIKRPDVCQRDPAKRLPIDEREGNAAPETEEDETGIEL